MPFATSIRLPRDHVPRFPDLCCGCLAASPRHFLKVSHRASSWWDLLLPWLWLFRDAHRCLVPICEPCRSQVRRHRLTRIVGVLVVLAVGTAILVGFGGPKALPRGWRKPALLGLLVVVGAPLWVWFVLRPLAVDTTVAKDNVDYEFASTGFAWEFHQLNPDGVCDDWEMLDRDELGEDDEEDDPDAEPHLDRRER